MGGARRGGSGRVGAVALTLLVSLAWASPLLANGRLPNSVSLHINPFDANQWVLGTTFGLGISADCGERFRFVCESVVVNAHAEQVENQGFAGEDFRAAFGAHGEIMIEGGNGASRSSDGGTTWTPMGGLPAQTSRYLGALAGSPSQKGKAWLPLFDTGRARGENVAGEGMVYATSDGGASWRALPLRADNLAWRQLRQQPNDPNTLTVVGYHSLRYLGPYLARSHDGGATWSTPALAAGLSGRFLRPHLLPHPRDAARMLIGGVRNVGDNTDHFEIYRSGDGGRSLQLSATLPAEVGGLAADADGERIWAALGNGSLWRSTDSGQSFQPLPLPRANSCVTTAAGLLWACGSGSADGFALAVSGDGGETFYRAAMLSQLTLPASPKGSLAAARCPATWAGLAGQLGANPAVGGSPPDLAATPKVAVGKACRATLAQELTPTSPALLRSPAAAPAPPASPRGATPPQPPARPEPTADPSRGGGCGCHAGIAAATPAGLLLAAAWAAAVVRRFSRRHRSGSR